ncbi:MAG: Sensory/regulatory protein RpfC [bacterium ADurb.Bin243]|nr:MAG: Sensory/regulatory protein RpfC [bacterium ADurb.Bin243]HOD39467.1 PAS domain S-box protein [Candidatus Wallbacteria bacterium]
MNSENKNTNKNKDAKYRAIFENMLDAFVFVDISGKIIECNKAYCDMLGYCEDELKNMNFRDITPQKWLDFEENIIKNQLIATGHSQVYEKEYIRKDGTVFPIELRTHLIKSEDGGIESMCAIIRDISERKKLEAEAAAESDFAKSLIETAQVIIVVLNENGKIALINPFFEKLCGLKSSDLIGKDWFETFLPPKDMERVRKIFLNAINDIESNGTINPIVLKDGREVDIEWYSKTLKDKNSKSIGLLSVGLDMTSHKLYESYRIVADYTLDWEYWRAPDGKYIYVSPACEAITGFSAREFIEDEELILKIAHPEDKSIIAGHIKDLKNGNLKTDHLIEFKIITKSGEVKYLEHKCRAIYRPDGTWLGNRGSNKDITERKIFEKELKAERDRANAATLAKSLFLAKMSHEIRTPMNSVIGFANLLKMTDLSPEQSDSVNHISGSAEKLLTIINDILDVSKIEAGKLTLRPAPFDPVALARDCVKSMSLAAASKNLTINEEYDEKLSRSLLGDQTRIRQIITNLINNAIKFTQKGCVKVAIKLTGEAPDSTDVEFSVSDTGIGIAPEMINKIFENYVQQDSELHRAREGTGLGLNIVKNLVELMGGKISVKSRPGNGSEFSVNIRFPKASGGEAFEKTPKISASPAMPEPAGKKLKLLIAEDEPANRRLIKKVIEMKGWEAVIVDDGEKAVEKASSEHFDAVLMDIQMPVMDGITASKAISRIFSEKGQKRPPIIVLTASTMPEEFEFYIRAGMDGIIPKPLNVINFYETVEKIIESGTK